MTSSPFTRERFLRLSTRLVLGLAGVLGMAGLFRYFSHTPGSNRPEYFDLGSADEFPTSGKMIRPEIPAVIYKDKSGYRAYSLTCTHLGCILEESQSGFSCPCHGSQFSSDGIVTRGPAVDHLPAWQIEQTGQGTLRLYLKETER